MSKWKQIVTNLARISAILGIAAVLNACVVASTPHGHYNDPYGPSAYVYWYYYPDYQVYYHITDHYYYYYDGGAWIRASRLPAGWVLRDQRRVRIKLNGIPYTRYSEHLRRYPPKRANHRRPGFDDRHDHDNSRQHRPDMDKKEGRNIFVPHTKEYKRDGKRRFPEKLKNSGDGKYYKDGERRYSDNIKNDRNDDNSKSERSSRSTKYKQKPKGREKNTKGKRMGDRYDREDAYDDDRPANRNREKIKEWRKD